MVQEHDVIIVGGGINGVGIARDCAMRNLRVLLVEKHDFAKGASGNNTGMIHGGIRYMRTRVKTTQESCLDSGYIQKIAPELIFRVPFLFPVLKNDQAALLLLEGAEIFFEAYDVFQPLKNGKTHTRLTRAEALSLEPGLNPNIIGAVSLDEWGIDAFRLTLLNALSARRYGAHVRTYCEVTDFVKDRKGGVVGVRFFDRESHQHEEHHAPVVINATGAWGPSLASLCGAKYSLRPGKGIHVVFSHRVSNYGMLLKGVDDRQLFFLPHGRGSILGTTDDDFYGSPDAVPILEDEVEYVLQAGAHLFPKLNQYRLSHAYVGVRPTLYAWGKNEDVLSREHQIIDHTDDDAPGLFSVTGGKLASFRLLAEEVSDLVAKRLGNQMPCRTHLEPLDEPQKVRCPNKALPVSEEVCLCNGTNLAEIEVSIAEECLVRLGGLRGRLHLAQGPCGGTHCLARASQKAAEMKNWSPEQQQAQLCDTLNQNFVARRSVLDGANLAAEELLRGAFVHTAQLHKFE